MRNILIKTKISKPDFNVTGKFIRNCRLFICGLMVLMAFPPSPVLAQGMTETQARLPNRDVGYYNIDAHLTVITHEAFQTSLYFWSQQFSFQDGDGGYMGLQTNGRDNNNGTFKRSALFSIFDNNDKVTRGIDTSDPNCDRRETSGGDGTFVSCIIPFDWVQGREYRLRVWWLGDQPGDRRRWGGWVQDVAFGRETFIGSIDVPRDWNWLGSYANAFTEYLSPPVKSCADIPFTYARWRLPTANGGRYTSSVGSYPDYPAGYGVCVDFARGFTFQDRIYTETGFGNSSRQDGIDRTIRHYYNSGLGRFPDTNGLAYWKSVVGDKRDFACSLAMQGVGHAMLSSSEFLGRWPDAASRVDRLYLTLLHRRPDPGGRDFWIKRIEALGNWSARVSEFLASTETVNRRLAICRNRF